MPSQKNIVSLADMLKAHASERRLSELPAGGEHTILAMPEQQGEHRADIIRAQAMGLQIGKRVHILRRSGRLMLLQIGATCLAVSCELAHVIKVQ